MKRYLKVIIIVFGITAIVIFTLITYALFTLFSESGVKEVELRSLDRQINFLRNIQACLNSCTDCEELKNRISERISQLQVRKGKVSVESNAKKFAKSIFSPGWPPMFVNVDELQFLLRIEKAIANCTKCETIREKISERAVMLRMRLSFEIAIDSRGNKPWRLTKELPKYFYVPSDANRDSTIRAFWRDGGRAIVYEVQRAFPGSDLINEFSEHYSVLSWKPLKYDLSQPLELGGLEGGWRKGPGDSYYWTQFWMDKHRNILNVNVCYYGHDKARVIIIYTKERQMKSALEYYYKIHGASDAEPNGQIVKMVLEQGYKFFPVRAI